MVQDTNTPVKKKLNIWQKISTFFGTERKAYIPPLGSSAAKLNDITYQARLELKQKEYKELNSIMSGIMEECRQRALEGYYYLELCLHDETPESSISDKNYAKIISMLEKEKGLRVTHLEKSLFPCIKIEW